MRSHRIRVTIGKMPKQPLIQELEFIATCPGSQILNAQLKYHIHQKIHHNDIGRPRSYLEVQGTCALHLQAGVVGSPPQKPRPANSCVFGVGAGLLGSYADTSQPQA